MLNEFLSRYTDPESLVAWYSVIDVASWLLSISREIYEGISAYERLGSAVLQEKDMRDVLSTKITLDALELGLSSQTSIESFLVGERERSPGGLGSIRNRLQFATEKYFGDELQFPSELVASTYLQK